MISLLRALGAVVLSTRKPTPVLWAIVELLTITWLALPGM